MQHVKFHASETLYILKCMCIYIYIFTYLAVIILGSHKRTLSSENSSIGAMYFMETILNQHVLRSHGKRSTVSAWGRWALGPSDAGVSFNGFRV